MSILPTSPSSIQQPPIASKPKVASKKSSFNVGILGKVVFALGILSNLVKPADAQYTVSTTPTAVQCENYFDISSELQTAGIKNGLLYENKNEYRGAYPDLCQDYGVICPSSVDTLTWNESESKFEAFNSTNSRLSEYDIPHGLDMFCNVTQRDGIAGATKFLDIEPQNGAYCYLYQNFDLGSLALIKENGAFFSKKVINGQSYVIKTTDSCKKISTDPSTDQTFTIDAGNPKTTTDFQNAIKDVNPVSPKELVAVKLEDLEPYTKQFVLSSDGSKRLESYDRLETTVTVNREPINSYTKLSELIRINSTTFYMNVADKRNGEFQYSQALTLTMGNFSKEITTHYPTLKNSISVNQQGDSLNLQLTSNAWDSSINFGDILVDKAEIYYAGETYELDKLSKPNTFSLDQQISVVEGLNEDVDLKIYNINGETLNENGEIQAGAFIELGQTNSDESVNELFELTLVNLLIAGSSILGLFLFTCLCMKCCMKANETDIQELKNKQSRLEESVGLLDTKLATEERIADSISKQVVRSLPQTPDRREPSAPIYTAVLVEDGTNPPVIPFGVDGPSRPIYNV